MKMSFILICYNQVNEIDQALASIFSQKLEFSYEVIVSDDGSSDGTLERIHAWQQQYPEQLKLLVHPRDNTQKYHALTRITNSIRCALKAMSGDYFCMIDGDDIYVSDNFAAQAIAVMEKNHTVNTVVFDFEYRYPEHAKRAFVGDLTRGTIKDKNRFVRKFYIHSGSHVFRNTLSSQRIEKLLSCPLLIDNVIVPFFIQHGDLYYIPEIAYSYKTYGGLWDTTPQEEQAVYTPIIALSLKEIAPQFRWAALARGKKHLSLLYKKRLLLKKALTLESFNILQKIAKKSGDHFFLTLLNWEEASLAEKLYAKIYFIAAHMRFFLEKMLRIPRMSFLKKWIEKLCFLKKTTVEK